MLMRLVRGALAAGALIGLMAAGWVAWPLPPALLAPEAQQSLTLEDRHGLALRSTRAGDGSLTRWFRLDEMDPDLPRAFVAVEDHRFYQHRGVDVRAIGRALRDNLRHGGVVSGASTITMQLARLLRPIGHGAGGKLLQTAWALRLEAHLDKAGILEQYLNRVPMGQGAVGVAAATRLYFGRAPTEVSLGQAALLAGLARAPSSQNPLVDPARAQRRREAGLSRLVADGYATPEEVDRARHEPLLGGDRGRPFLAPHFTSRVLLDGAASGRRAAGTWRTSLDLALQAALEDEVRHTVDQLRDRGARQAALVVLDNRSGEILAWVGSPDFWADSAGQVDMVVSGRQPGSALKPFLYALAFDRGATAATVLADVATTYQTGGGPYHPRNYDRTFHGPVRAREALASSYNVPAVELASRIGYATLLHGLQAGGFASLDRSPEHYGLGLALGNGDVTLLELANGYRALANGGVWTPARWWSGDANQPSGEGHRVVSPRAAALVLDILADPEARIPAFGIGTPFDWPFRAAAKTGTSRHFTDNWAVAVTAGFTVGVWVGNFDGRPMEGVSGITGAGPLLHRAVLVTAQRYVAGALPTAAEAGLLPARICRLSGALAGAECPTMTEYFLPGTMPTATCRWHQEGRVELPVEYAEWRATTAGGTAAPRPAAMTQAPAGRVPAAPTARLTITSPQHGDHYQIPPGVEGRYATIPFRAAGVPAGAPLRWLLDGRPVAAGRWTLVPGRHRVRAVAGALSDEVEITVAAAGG
ncbi:MAG: penicillin-binding protein 1C [Gemmatimonadales bacterium]|nr:penicillin-binding protein 1C [Gemmatimonadales bacterium]